MPIWSGRVTQTLRRTKHQQGSARVIKFLKTMRQACFWFRRVEDKRLG
jgi:hypothetical protein